MLGGDRKTFLQRKGQAFIGIDKFARHIRLTVDIAGAGMRFKHQVERSLRRLEAVLRQEAGDITRRHGGEARHTVD